MEFLSEDRIKKAGLRFLKAYYRQRERSGSGATISRYDVVSEEGIIADGHLSFESTTGAPFSATLEATSVLTKEEVKYRMQYAILFWDSIEVASVLTALIFSYSYAFNHFTIKQIGLFPSFGLLFLLILIIASLYQRFFRWKNRYHYIYAIEQFKKYHADEQWIAIGEDVFDHPEDEIFLELKEQCVLNGFGLIEIDFEEKSKLLITPSRNEVFGKVREQLSFEPRNLASQKAKANRYSKLWNEKVIGRISMPGKKMLQRYQLSYVRQVMLSGFSFLLIGGIFHRELQQTEIVYLDEKEYLDSMYRFSETTFPEVEEFILDTPFVDPIHKEIGYLNSDAAYNNIITEYDGTPIDLNSEESEVLEIQAIPDKPFHVIITSETGRQMRYDCERLYGLNGNYYLVLDNIYSKPGKALKRVARLNGADINVNAFNLDCFIKGDQRYLVYFDLFYSDKKDAELAAKQYEKLLNKKGFSNNKITIHPIEINK